MSLNSLGNVRQAWETVFRENRPIHLADLTGRECSTITRRFEKDDRLEAFPASDFLQVVRGLRKEQPDLARSVIDYVSASNQTTQSLDVGSRLSRAVGTMAELIEEVMPAIPQDRVTGESVRRIRRQWALTIHAMNKTIAAMEAKLESQGSVK